MGYFNTYVSLHLAEKDGGTSSSLLIFVCFLTNLGSQKTFHLTLLFVEGMRLLREGLSPCQDSSLLRLQIFESECKYLAFLKKRKSMLLRFLKYVGLTSLRIEISWQTIVSLFL
jgi:hypothetical protein